MFLAACGPSVPSDPALSAEQEIAISDAFLSAQEGMSGQIHVVQAGETLCYIGRLYDVSWQDIAAANGIVPPYTIYAGEGLLIPGPALAEPPSLLSAVDEGVMDFDPSQLQLPASPGADWYPASDVPEPEYPIDMGEDAIIPEGVAPRVTQITVVIEEPEPAPAAGAQECLGRGGAALGSNRVDPERCSINEGYREGRTDWAVVLHRQPSRLGLRRWERELLLHRRQFERRLLLYQNPSFDALI